MTIKYKCTGGHDRCPQCNCAEPPIVCLPLMKIPAPVEKGTKYLPEVWKPNG